LQLIDLKQAAVAQRQRRSPIAANSIAANRFQATSGSAAAATQPIQLQLIDLKQAAVAQRQRRSQFNFSQFNFSLSI
jgi:hypothetical protein